MPETATPTLRGKIAKVDAEERLVFGWASVVAEVDGSPLVDSQGDILDLPSLESAVYGFVEDSRQAGEMHTKRVGRLVESFMVTPEKLEKMGLAKDALPPGAWMGFRIENDEAWEKVKNGEYSMFSIGGVGERSEA